MSNKTEAMYDLIFKSVIRILTQQHNFELNIITITTDTELALINSVENNFRNTQRIGCWFHLHQDLIREAKIMGLLNSKNKNINIDTTYEVINQLTILPLNYKGNIEYVKKIINILINQYPKYTNYIVNYFSGNKLKYFEDGTYNYSNFPKDIRSNSILERYNKNIKNELGEKRTCNWVKFMNFINREIERINENLGKNENINVLYESKQTKFGKSKYININNPYNIDNTKEKNCNIQNNKITIADKWLKQQNNNCRYNSFITVLYFIFSSFLKDKKDTNLTLLNELNDLIIKLTNDMTIKNYIDIIVYLQKNKIDSNNTYIDRIVNEEDEQKKLDLINNRNSLT